MTRQSAKPLLSAEHLPSDSTSDEVRAPSGARPALSTAELTRELLDHQLELETQNEELRRSQLELKDAHERYVDLYDFAPVGYLTLCCDGLITSCNLTAAAMLGLARVNLLGQRVTRFIAAASTDVWHIYAMDLARQSEPRSVELRVRAAEGHDVEVLVNGQRVEQFGNAPMLRVVLSPLPGGRHSRANDPDRTT